MLSFFINNLNAAETATPQPSTTLGIFYQLIPFVLIFVVFYFLLIRPQRKKQAELKNMISSLKAGDVILLSSGIKAKIVKIKDENFVTAEISNNVEIDVMKSYIITVIK